ncbi:formimidoylglutamase [uncultured Dokdonia sp.]|uniref:formimidoylglutamase n=1 Tax=uncultured Dokdonia sp. TaxID=575653 RepID=UPI00262E9C2A|nr:formimidoylglutamase [uncultured Dokdonia sp.]
MIQLHIQSQETLEEIISKRDGETKIGEKLQYCHSLEAIEKCTAKYIIFGIAEDYGVRANYGKRGTANAWDAFLKSFVNIQENDYNKGTDILLLGYISVTPDDIQYTTPKPILGDVVKRIDKKVAYIVQTIVATGKIPIIIGGGHNNAYGNISGASQALGHAINVMNIDAHTDLRTTDYRHSGNGFSYALSINASKETTLDKYTVFGLHKNYTPQYIFDLFKKHKDRLQYHFLEDTWTTDTSIAQQYATALQFVSQEAFGLELDCDAITNFPSSARTPSGLYLNDVRQFVMHTASQKKCCYFHICEASPGRKKAGQVGKAISYFVSDFIRTHHAN